MLKFAYQIGVELALTKLAQAATMPAQVLRSGSRVKFLENLRKALQTQGGVVPKAVQSDIAKELSFYERGPELSRVLREAYGLTGQAAGGAAEGMSPLAKILGVSLGGAGIGAALGSG